MVRFENYDDESDEDEDNDDEKMFKELKMSSNTASPSIQMNIPISSDSMRFKFLKI